MGITLGAQGSIPINRNTFRLAATGVAPRDRPKAGNRPVSYAKGDENSEPSVYMDYGQALTLGKLQLHAWQFRRNSLQHNGVLSDSGE